MTFACQKKQLNKTTCEVVLTQIYPDLLSVQSPQPTCLEVFLYEFFWVALKLTPCLLEPHDKAGKLEREGIQLFLISPFNSSSVNYWEN